VAQFLEYSRDFYAWILMAAFVILFFAVPVARILKRTGHSPLWSLTLFVPLAAYFGLWIFAFKRWPVDDNLDRAESLAEVET
jgi:hypothetical protein